MHDTGDPPIYTNVAYPWSLWPPNVPRADNPTAVYRTTFELPDEWVGGMAGGERVYLRLDGVDSACFVWLNGERVGYSQDSRLACEFEITPWLRANDANLLTLQV